MKAYPRPRPEGPEPLRFELPAWPQWCGRLAGTRIARVAAVAATASLLFWSLSFGSGRAASRTVIAPGDHLRVEKRDFSTGVLLRAENLVVDEGGAILVAGRRLKAAGVTADELARALTGHYAHRDHGRQRVVVRATRPVTIEVSAPASVLEGGAVALPAGVTLSQAFESLRPGPAFRADQVELVRRGGISRHDLISLAAGADRDPVLEDGDRVVLAARDPGEAAGYWLLGAVDEPGRRPVLTRASLGDLLAEGTIPEGHVIQLVRGWPDRPQLFRIPPELAPGDMPLEAEDMVLVSAKEGLLAERAGLTALVLGLARRAPIVMAASGEDATDEAEL